jgi:hypothetical protein
VSLVLATILLKLEIPIKSVFLTKDLHESMTIGGQNEAEAGVQNATGAKH